MVSQTFTRRKAGREYRYGVYRCGFAAAKGPAVCSHGRSYRAERLEAALMDRFRGATTGLVGALTASVNGHLAGTAQ
jgi:hypothetical protein